MNVLPNLFAIGLSGPELWVILAVILLLFGAKKLPELMRGIGQGVGELQKGINESQRAIETIKHEAEVDTTRPEEAPKA
ncbi:MAG TPA: twin-arginine translocase TatA/TatE family subunit [Fimbriimonadaceae bacterium]|nr:twin-arginine translocase TatA/TatE family subunit [Fimbriimonadaceae bacterium]